VLKKQPVRPRKKHAVKVKATTSKSKNTLRTKKKKPSSKKDDTVSKEVKKNAPKKEKTKKPFKNFVSYDAQSGTWIIDQNHEYYHQIQGQLYFTNKQIGLFFVWTLNDCAVIEIKKDPSWATNIDKLLDFYFEYFLPHIVDNPKKDIDNFKERIENVEILADEDDSDFVDVDSDVDSLVND